MIYYAILKSNFEINDYILSQTFQVVPFVSGSTISLEKWIDTYNNIYYNTDMVLIYHIVYTYNTIYTVYCAKPMFLFRSIATKSKNSAWIIQETVLVQTIMYS